MESVTSTSAVARAGTRPKSLRIHFLDFIQGHWHPVLATGVYGVSLLALGAVVWARFQHLDGLLFSREGLLLFGLAFLVPWVGFIAATIGAWRALQRVKGRGFFRSNLAEFVQITIAITGGCVLLWSIGDVPSSVIAIYQAIPSLHESGWKVLTRGDAIAIGGTIGDGLADAIDKSIETTPGLRMVFLNSPGGYVDEATRIADAIRAKGLSTVVRHRCDSACTIIFSAGRKRILLPTGQLGFHACRDPIFWYSRCDSRDQENYMVADGIDRRFLHKALAVDWHGMWYPSLAQLLDAHVITGTKLEGQR